MGLSIISLKDDEEISRRHLNFFQRLDLKIGQRKVKSDIAVDGIGVVIAYVAGNNCLEQAVGKGDFSAIAYNKSVVIIDGDVKGAKCINLLMDKN